MKYKLEINIITIAYLVIALAVSVLGNIVANQWALDANGFYGLWFIGLLVVSPLVYITFGLVVQKVGVSIGSATIDSLTALVTISVGLFILGEFHSLELHQLGGISLMIMGLVLMQIKKTI